MESEKLFWGLVVEQGKQYKQTPKFNFHVSMAVLDLKTANDESSSLYVQVDNLDYLLCNLNKNQSNIQLDIIFSEGEKIKFYSAGKGNIHLTGYVMPDEIGMDGLSDLEDEDDEISVGSDDVQQFFNKRKNTETIKLQGKESKKLKTNDGKAAENNAAKQPSKVIDVDPKQLVQNKKQEQPKKQQNQAQPLKKQPAKQEEVDSDSDNDDDLSIDDDDSIDVNKMMDESDDSQGLVDDELDLESDDDEDEDEDVKKLLEVKKQINKPNQGKPNQGKPNQGKPNQQNFQKKPDNKQNNKPNGQFNKSWNKTPQNKNLNASQKQSGQKQQTPFNHNKNQNSNKKNGSPFQHQNKNKSFGSNNKHAKKQFA